MQVGKKGRGGPCNIGGTDKAVAISTEVPQRRTRGPIRKQGGSTQHESTEDLRHESGGAPGVGPRGGGSGYVAFIITSHGPNV